MALNLHGVIDVAIEPRKCTAEDPCDQCLIYGRPYTTPILSEYERGRLDGVAAERERVADFARRLNYGPSLRTFVKKLRRGEHDR